MKEFYESNKDFRDYVDRYCKGKFTVEEALRHIQVRLVAAYYREVEEEKKNILVDVKE